MCSAVAQQCMPPVQVAILSNFYDCMVRGYSESTKKTQEIGKQQINEHQIYMKFQCEEIKTTES
jgi:hypothetical protein